MESLKLAIARDDAFCFYYQENIRTLERAGFEPIYFSPLAGDIIPESAAGLYIGGGYPELHAKRLSENADILVDIKQKAISGMPIFAECGGFMYLTRIIETAKEKAIEEKAVDAEVGQEAVDINQNKAINSYPMCGVFDSVCSKRDRLVRFGYVEIFDETGKWLGKGKSIRGHEFHYYDSTDNGKGALVKKAATGQTYKEIHVTDAIWAGWPHLYLASSECFAENFYRKCLGYMNASVN